MCVCVCVCVCKMKYYSAIKNKEILQFVTIWVALEGIMLGEISQTVKGQILCGTERVELSETVEWLLPNAGGR